MPEIIEWIFGQFSLPGIIGMALGYWLLGTGVKNGKNILDSEPWHPIMAIALGGIGIGLAIWFLIGVILGFAGVQWGV